MTAALTEITGRAAATGTITAADVMAMRGVVYGADAISRDEMEALAALESSAAARGPEWAEFFAEAMVDFAVRQEDPPDFIDDANAGWVMRVMAGPARPESGLEALARMLETAEGAPAALDSFAVRKAKDTFCAKGRMDASDVALMRRLVFAGGGEDNIGVSRDEADALFDIHDACRSAANDASWAHFFAQAVGDSLVMASPFHLESRDDATSLETWEESPTRMSDFIAGMAKRPDVKGALHEILHPHADAEDEWRDENARFESAAAAAGEITDEKARWLVGRLSQGELTGPERRLIAFLKERATKVSGLLAPLLGGEPAAVSEGSPEPAPVFGHRKTPPSAA